jgi:hypothetical protein
LIAEMQRLENSRDFRCFDRRERWGHMKRNRTLMG